MYFYGVFTGINKFQQNCNDEMTIMSKVQMLAESNTTYTSTYIIRYANKFGNASLSTRKDWFTHDTFMSYQY